MPPILALLAALAASLAGHAAAEGGRVVDLRLEAGAVPGGLAYSVYLPAGHGANKRRFPVVYLLHGYGANRRQWLDDGVIATTLDALIAEGAVPPMIAVMPEAANSWYLDSAAFGGPGDYATAIARDLVAEVDRRFMTRPEAAARAIAGVSMGGFGALGLAFRHPGRFGVVAALSPAIWKPGAVSWRHGPAAMPPAAAAAKFVANAPGGFDLDAFAVQVPFAAVAAVAAQDAPPRVLLTVGDDDFFEHYDGTLEMFLDLRAAGLKPELRVADGGHDWAHWRAMARELLGFLARAWAPAS